MALGKNTTIGEIEDVVRLKTGTIGDNRLSPTMFLNLVNYNAAELGKKMMSADDPLYVSTQALTFSTDSVSIASYKVQRILKIVDSSLGIFTPLEPKDFERQSSFTNLYTSSLFYTLEGETIRRAKGSALGAYATDTMYFYRAATNGTARTDYPDTPDAYTSLLIKMVEADVWAYKKGARNEELDVKIAKDIDELRVAIVKANS